MTNPLVHDNLGPRDRPANEKPATSRASSEASLTSSDLAASPASGVARRPVTAAASVSLASCEGVYAASAHEVTDEMIAAGAAVLCDPHRSTPELVEWLDSLAWAGGTHLDVIVVRMYRAMRDAEAENLS
jgi:hypothetical protein